MKNFLQYAWTHIEPYVFAKTKAYIGGSITGIIIWIDISITKINLPELPLMEWGLRVLGVGVIGMISGGATEFGTQWVRKKINRNKPVENEQQEQRKKTG